MSVFPQILVTVIGLQPWTHCQTFIISFQVFMKSLAVPHVFLYIPNRKKINAQLMEQQKNKMAQSALTFLLIIIIKVNVGMNC